MFRKRMFLNTAQRVLGLSWTQILACSRANTKSKKGKWSLKLNDHLIGLLTNQTILRCMFSHMMTTFNLSPTVNKCG